ncbi:MAG: hypothetical protein JEZ00_06810 [Anaerolineaceae bacterium]|nr:hypothetical protein [Anaerolineaceae bacterium]
MQNSNWPRLIRIAVRVVFFLIIFNVLFALIQPQAFLGKISAYNVLFPGRERFPFGEYPQEAYNLTINNVDAMFASHEINANKNNESEYRVLVVGDSSVWGTLLRPEETLSAELNALELKSCDGRQIHFYNMGYPTLSWMKDLVILKEAQRYQPDMILWMVTLESAASSNQLASPILMNNSQKVDEVLSQMQLNAYHLENENSNLLENDMLTKRRDLADLVRLQMYGVMWSASGIDQYYPDRFELARRDFSADETDFLDYDNPLHVDDLALDVLEAGRKLYADIPILIVNEPIMISSGENSELRYNHYYPRWAYDQYREMMTTAAELYDWQYFDLWNLVNEYEFTNTAIHTTPNGTQLTAEKISEVINDIATNPDTCQVKPQGQIYQLPTETPLPTLTATPTIDAAIATPTITPTLTVLSKPPVCNAEEWEEIPAIPQYVSPELIQLYKDGIENGNNPNGFSVIGDCQNVPTVFLGIYDNPSDYRLGDDYAYLQDVIDYYQGSFARRGAAVSGGFNVASILSPLRADPAMCESGESPLTCELRLQKPSVVFISMETWWAKRPADIYEGYMREIIDTVLESGAVPILITKADNLEGDHGINQTIVKLGCEYQIPIFNFWSAAQPLPDHGLWTDEFHLTVGQAFFDDKYQMRTGRTMRNLTALQSLYAVWSILQQ